MTHKEYADSLRLIADFFENNEQVALPHDAEEFRYFAAQSKEDMSTVAKALGSCKKVILDDFFELHAKFGAILFNAVANRGRVCERVVVGKETIPERVVPEQIVPEHEVEIIEWRCPEALMPSRRIADAADLGTLQVGTDRGE